MRKLLLILLILPIVSFADEVRIAVGMDYNNTISVIKKHGGSDITPRMEVMGPKGEWPVVGLYWAFSDYDAIISLSGGKDGKVTGISLWTRKDFGENKLHRAKTEQKIEALKIDTKTKKVSIEKKKDAD
jgi:hypothetical protein